MAKSRSLQRMSVIIVAILTVSFLYVWQRIQIFRLGYKIRNSEKRLEEIKEENAILQFKISQLTSPQNIKREVKKLGLDLRPPKENQIIRVK